MGENLLEDMVITHVLIDIYKTTTNDLTEKYHIIKLALEEMFELSKQSNALVKKSIEQSVENLGELWVLQYTFAENAKGCEAMKSYLIWLLKKFRNKHFLEHICKKVDANGSVMNSVKSFKVKSDGSYIHQIISGSKTETIKYLAALTFQTISGFI